MKKTLISAIAILSIAAVSVLLYVNKEKIEREMLIIANAEALSESNLNSGRCYKMISSDPSDVVKYCGTCSEIPGRWRGGMSFCTNQKKDTAEDTKN